MDNDCSYHEACRYTIQRPTYSISLPVIESVTPQRQPSQQTHKTQCKHESPLASYVHTSYNLDSYIRFDIKRLLDIPLDNLDTLRSQNHWPFNISTKEGKPFVHIESEDKDYVLLFLAYHPNIN
jgi:hypothetical protein